MRDFSKISNTENAIITAEKGGNLIIVSRIIIIKMSGVIFSPKRDLS